MCLARLSVHQFVSLLHWRLRGKVLLLDEPTSALDVESEGAVLGVGPRDTFSTPQALRRGAGVSELCRSGACVAPLPLALFCFFFTRPHTCLCTAALVQAALRNAFAGRTVVIVAHRLATIASADRVVVLANGRLLEQGPPAELAALPGGAFAELLQKQSLVVGA